MTREIGSDVSLPSNRLLLYTSFVLCYNNVVKLFFRSAVIAATLTSCSSAAVDKTQVDSAASSTEVINPALPTELRDDQTELRDDQIPVYEMAMQFLSQTIAVSPGLRKNVESVEPIAICMVLAGYQINNIPPPG